MTLPMAANMSYSPMLSEEDVKVEALSKTCSSAHVSEARGTRATRSPGPTAQPATVTVRGRSRRRVDGDAVTLRVEAAWHAAASIPTASRALT